MVASKIFGTNVKSCKQMNKHLSKSVHIYLSIYYNHTLFGLHSHVCTCVSIFIHDRFHFIFVRILICSYVWVRVRVCVCIGVCACVRFCPVKIVSPQPPQYPLSLLTPQRLLRPQAARPLMLWSSFLSCKKRPPLKKAILFFFSVKCLTCIPPIQEGQRSRIKRKIKERKRAGKQTRLKWINFVESDNPKR